VGESARSITKKASAAAVERTAELLMPALFKRLDRIDERLAGLDRGMNDRFGAIDREMYGLREHFDARLDKVRDQINELGLRVIHLEGRLEEVVRVIGFQNDRLLQQSAKLDQWIERLVRLEMTRTARRGKRAS
jgi:hypothetical protein